MQKKISSPSSSLSNRDFFGPGQFGNRRVGANANIFRNLYLWRRAGHNLHELGSLGNEDGMMCFLAGYRRNSQKIEIKYISRIFVDRASAKSRNFWSIIEAIIPYQIRWRDGRAERKKMEPEFLWLRKWDSFQSLFPRGKGRGNGSEGVWQFVCKIPLSSFFRRLPFFYNPVGWRQRLLLPTHRLPRERKRKKEKVIARVQVRPDGFSLLFLPKRIRHFARAGKENHQKSTVSPGFLKNITSFWRKNCWNQSESGSVSNTLFSQTGPSAPSPSFREWPSCFPRKITIYFRR